MGSRVHVDIISTCPRFLWGYRKGNPRQGNPRHCETRGWKGNNWISLIHYSIYFFLSYSLFFIQYFARYSLFRFEFVEQLWLHRRCNSINALYSRLASPTQCSPKIDQSMFTVETVVSQTKLFFFSVMEKKYRY